jgi:hypothetical protein
MKWAQKKVFDTDPKMSEYSSVIADNGNPENSIYYKHDMLKLEDHGTVKTPYYGDKGVRAGHGDSVWGLFTVKETGQQFILINAHLPAWNADPGSDPGAALKREAGAKILQDVIAELKEKYPGINILLTGDLNSTRVIRYTDKETPRPKDPALDGDRRRLPYCELTAEPNKLQDTRDMVKGLFGHCINRENDGKIKYTVDWVMGNPKFTEVKAWELDPSQAGSDHRALAVTLKLLNDALAQPLQKAIVKQPPAVQLDFKVGNKQVVAWLDQEPGHDRAA